MSSWAASTGTVGGGGRAKECFAEAEEEALAIGGAERQRGHEGPSSGAARLGCVGCREDEAGSSSRACRGDQGTGERQDSSSPTRRYRTQLGRVAIAFLVPSPARGVIARAKGRGR